MRDEPQIIDQRPGVGPTRRLGVPPGGRSTIDAIVEAARSMGIDPEIAAALAITEGHHDYGLTFPLRGTQLEAFEGLDDGGRQQLVAETALRHLRERANAVGGPIERQLQAYNGMGMLPPGYYGQQEPIDAGADLPYGRRVMDVVDNVLPHSSNVIRPPTPSRTRAVSPLAGLDHIFQEEISKDLDIQRRRPGLLKRGVEPERR